jgi:Na+-transporting NADH:ubiquinone oxidoreductase subunit F
MICCCTAAWSFNDSRAYIDVVNTGVRDYSIVGPERQVALERGLADATWYTSPIPREKLRVLMERRNGPAVRDTLLWFALLGSSGYLAHRSWGTWWMIPAFFVYGTLYGSVSDSRWHECGHRTAFKTAWMNDAVYFLASFMVWREAVSWRWSHIRHHSDTIIVGRDPEIAFQRPMKARGPLKEFLGLSSNPGETKKILLNVFGRFTPDELDYLPATEHSKVIRTARIYVAIWIAVLAFCVSIRSAEPLMFVILPSFYGKWLLVSYGITQHAGLAEDTLDHRLNGRSVHMNRLHRYLYWNMNFHAEHHMFPSVPFHALPALSEAISSDFPPQYSGFRQAYREIWSVYQRQKVDPAFFVDRSSLLPPPTAPVCTPTSSEATTPPNDNPTASADGWIRAANSSALVNNDVIRFDHGDETFALYRLNDGRVRATDGLCTHAKVHLCGGAVRDGQIECPKHHGLFDLETGKAVGRPVTVDIRVHEIREVDDWIEIRPAGLLPQ